MLAVSLIILLRLHCALSVPGFTLPSPKLDQKPNPRLIPANTMPPLPGKHNHGSSSGYHGCLGLSADELLAASNYFQDDIPPCAVYVNDTVVAGNGDSTSSGSSGSGGSSSGSGGSSSGSDDSTGGSVEGGSSGGSSGGSGSGSSGGSSDGSSGGSSGGSDSGSPGDYGTESSGNNDRSNNDDGGSSSNGNSYGSSNDDGDYSSPLVYFDLSDCGSYSNLWMWDLALSCDNSTSLHNCKCTSAEILFQYGTLECPDGSSGAPSCPSSCPVCNTCMDLIGCVTKSPGGKRIPVNIPVNLERTVNRTLPIALGVAAGVASLLAGAAAHRYKNRNQGKGSVGTLNSALVDEQDHSTVDADPV
ncbi:hypothetical protein HJC23_010523 [Cyclotella cryptica]|uniref:Uncharacterized protein n=1 Tax=Cyclotella cryptica TaxID=29204 RepID=A0ABD3QAK8_9STRA